MCWNFLSFYYCTKKCPQKQGKKKVCFLMKLVTNFEDKKFSDFRKICSFKLSRDSHILQNEVRDHKFWLRYHQESIIMWFKRYIEAIMWWKCGCCRISARHVMIVSTSKGIQQKSSCFRGVSIVVAHLRGLALGVGVKNKLIIYKACRSQKADENLQTIPMYLEWAASTRKCI